MGTYLIHHFEECTNIIVSMNAMNAYDLEMFRVPGNYSMFRVLDIIFKTRPLLGTRRNTTFLLDSYPMANADNLFINICIPITNITGKI